MVDSKDFVGQSLGVLRAPGEIIPSLGSLASLGGCASWLGKVSAVLGKGRVLGLSITFH